MTISTGILTVIERLHNRYCRGEEDWQVIGVDTTDYTQRHQRATLRDTLIIIIHN